MTELGEIPIEWEVVNLEDLADINRGASPRPIKDPKWFSEESEIGWVRIADVTKSKKYLRQTVQYLSDEGVLKSRYVKHGDLIMSICGTIGRPVILAMEACIHDGFVVFNNMDVNKIDKNFLIYILNSLEDYFKSQGQPGTQVNINTSIVGKTSLALPPIKEQQKIAEILFTVDEQIENTDKIIEKTKELKKGLMQQLFTRGIGHTEFKNTELGKIPKEWTLIKLEQITERITYGFTNPMPTTEKGPFMITAKDIINGRINYITARKTDEQKYKQELTPKSRPEINDILITKDGTLGRLAIVDKENICINQSVASIKVNETLVFVKYLFYLMDSPTIQSRILFDAGGSTIKHIYISKLAQMIIPISMSLEEQQKIAEILTTLDNHIEFYEQEKEKYSEFKKGLMQQLLTGNIRMNSMK
ncbi:restriction endonuclease subunit S [Neobacillus drentensis]|uniref:restriction endonuclease subunit S n=1 Tax=Neobacillus drentensis TaxID=220684 RepID=UPI0030005714